MEIVVTKRKRTTINQKLLFHLLTRPINQNFPIPELMIMIFTKEVNLELIQLEWLSILLKNLRDHTALKMITL